METSDEGRTVKASETTFAILELLFETGGGRVTQVAEHLDMSKSNAHRHLKTLLKHDFLVKEGDVYKLSLKFLHFGEYVRNQEEAYRMAESVVKKLAEETTERAQFIVEEHGHGVYVHRKRGENAVKTDPGIGSRIPLHSSAAGKAILAGLPEQRAEEILDQQRLEPLTDETITDKEELLGELGEIRELGYSINDQEYIQGLRAIGTSVKSANDMPLGALSISGPSGRMTEDRLHNELLDLLLGMSNELELNVSYQSGSEIGI